MNNDEPIAGGKILTPTELLGIMHRRSRRGEPLTVLPLTRDQLMHLLLSGVAPQLFDIKGGDEETFSGAPVRVVRG